MQALTTGIDPADPHSIAPIAALAPLPRAFNSAKFKGTSMRSTIVRSALLGCAWWMLSLSVAAAQAPTPLISSGQPVTWWAVFKFNAGSFAGCGGTATLQCTFGGDPKTGQQFGEQFVFASSDAPTLKKGTGCNGETSADPVGATYGQIYNGNFHYVVWNDQFYDDPKINGCTKECGSPWGHSKGMLAWDDDGDGVVIQVTTPSWPASGSQAHPRSSDGNTLGCVADNDILVSQHFFALKLNKDDVAAELQALANASVVTDPSDVQIVNSGGPANIQALVAKLGIKSTSKTITMTTLSSGVQLISKPSAVHVPPWQMVSAELGGVPLRVATWWAAPKIPTTTSESTVSCWDAQLSTPGAVEIATTGVWDGTALGLVGTPSPSGNHAKIGVSTDQSDFAIFGDMNQQGAISGGAANCKRSQNGRGGLFYAVKNHELSQSVGAMLTGDSGAQ
jgi:Deoxyribonuclease II